MGDPGVRQFPGRAAGHRHLPPGQPRAYRPVRVDRPRRERRDARLSRHFGRHRQPYDDGQRPRRARLGRRRDRGRSGDARPAGQHAGPRGRRLPPRRRIEGGDHRHRPRADGHPDASPEGRRRPLRRILRARARHHDRRRPRDHRQHGARIWRDLRLLPDRPAHPRLSRADWPRRRPHRAGQGLCAGPGPMARRGEPGAAVHRYARARHGHDRAVARRSQAAAGPGAGQRRRRPVQP